jgi:hypothetical protein
VYNHLPHVDPTRSLDARHRAPRSEKAELRARHHEQVAAARARDEELSTAPIAANRITRPVAAILSLVGVRR